jgi:aspartate carbamoyltransferase catalytic subunit
MRRRLDGAGREMLRDLHRHKTLITLFYEPSTRTRLSFEMAATLLGMHVRATENASEFSSAFKGESVEDTIQTISGFRADVIVIRHKENGIVERVADYSKVPLINGGDGAGQHPTQAATDIFTIYDEKGRIDGLTVVLGGDLKYGRTVRSLAYLLSKFDGVRIIFVSHEQFRIGDDIKDHLRERNVEFEETDSVETALRAADVVYWTRTQKERMGTELLERSDQIISQFTIGRDQMEWMKADAVLMHPLPRIGEITTEVNKDSRAAYFRQAWNGVPVRMTLLDRVLRGHSF